MVETGSSLLAAARACRGCALVQVHDGRSVHAAALARRLFGVPYVITRRVDNPIRNNVVTRHAYRRALAVVVLSRAIERQVHALDADIDCTFIPDATSGYPMHERNVARLREQYKDCYVVGHIGALDHAHKGQRDLLAVAKETARTHPNVRYVLLGRGVDEAEFREAADALPNVEMVGHVDNVGDYLTLFDVFAFPSLHEGMGSTLLDAMEYGLPIVATRVGGIPDFVRHGENGVLVEPSNPDQLRFAILSMHDDPQRAAGLAAAGRQTAAEYSSQRMVERYLEVYRPVLNLDALMESS